MLKTGSSTVLPPSKKLKRINDLRRKCPYVIKAALSEILQDVEAFGVPEAKSSKDMRKATYEDLSQWDHYGPLFQPTQMVTKTGTLLSLVIVNMLSLLYASCKMGGHFYECMMSALEAHGPTDEDHSFKLLLYSDECLPANPLAGSSNKKIWVCYASFANFGGQLLSREDSWLPLLILRSSYVEKLNGKMSQVIKHILHSIFHSSVASPQFLGLLLERPNGSKFRVHFRMGHFIQDGASQRECFGIKGDGGSKFCLMCSNQICISMGGKCSDDDNAVCKATCKADLVLSTNEEVLASFDRLKEKWPTISAKEFQQWEQATGWTFTNEGIMACDKVREYLLPVSMFMHDWMHAMCSSGCMNIALYLVLETLAKYGLGAWKAMQPYLNCWVLPKVFASINLEAIFSPSRVESHRKSKKIKA